MGASFGRNQRIADGLYACSKATARAFLSDALKRGIVTRHNGFVAVLPDAPDDALTLGYVLVCAGYSLQATHRTGALRVFRTWFKEILARQTLAQHRRFFFDVQRALPDGAKRVSYFPPSPTEIGPLRDLMESRYRKAEETAEEVVAGFKRNAAHPLEPAYQLLLGCFGGKGEAAELEARYGPILVLLMSEARKSTEAL